MSTDTPVVDAPISIAMRELPCPLPTTIRLPHIEIKRLCFAASPPLWDIDTALTGVIPSPCFVELEDRVALGLSGEPRHLRSPLELHRHPITGRSAKNCVW